MSRVAPPTTAKPSEARERLLSAASQLFYAEGIGSVGVGRIVAEGQVTLATFYRHFPTKQDLVLAYLDGVHAHIAAQHDTAIGGATGRDALHAIGREVTGDLSRPGFRGCAFLNAASEFEDPQHPVRASIAKHRDWYRGLVRRAFDEAGHPMAGNAARHFVMLRDGAVSSAYLETPAKASRTFKRGVDGLLMSIDLPQHTSPAEDDGR